jgi:hypothetical protein
MSKGEKSWTVIEGLGNIVEFAEPPPFLLTLGGHLCRNVTS